MKINGTPILAQQKPQVKEDRKDKASAQDSVNDSAVELNVSQRNRVEKDSESSFDKSGIPELLQSLRDNTESTMQLHSKLTPERVLQLLA